MTNLFLLKAGKSTGWEDGGWGAWDEAELQEPVSSYICVFIASFPVLVGFSTCFFFSCIVITWARRILTSSVNVTAWLSLAPVIVSKYSLDVTCSDNYSYSCILWGFFFSLECTHIFLCGCNWGYLFFVL